MLMVTISRGISFPLVSTAFLTANSRPPQHGTIILATVTEEISLDLIISASFSE